MKEILLITITTLLSSFYSGCKTHGPGPEAALLNFLEAMSVKDFEKAKTYATPGSKAMIDFIRAEKMNNQDPAGWDLSCYKKENVEFKTNIEKETAVVTVLKKDKNEGTNFYLEKENENWKVDFDISAFLQLSFDKITGNESASPDSLKINFSKLNAISVDSIKSILGELKKN